MGVTYEGLYEPGDWGLPLSRFEEGRLVGWSGPGEAAPWRRVVEADFVSMEEGTGIVHVAPAFGADDYVLGRREGLAFLQPVDLQGRMTGPSSPFRGLFVKDADARILEDLKRRGLLAHHTTIHHTYPFCWRCETPLLYYAKPSWYIATTKVLKSLRRSNRELIHWHPEHLRDGRYGDWLANNVDWAISRERYWGTPLPIWRCQGCDGAEAVGSFDELRNRARQGEALDLSDPHRPFIDEVVLDCPTCRGEMRRIPEVADAWFDSGAMPYAQWHYPFENAEAFGAHFPADFICEGVDQTRGWFYSLHAEATLLHAAGATPEPTAYRHVMSLGHILDEAGEKMSKSKGNVVDPWQVLDDHGADALRWYLYTASPPGNSRRFGSAPGRGRAAAVPAQAVEHLLVLRHLRQHRRVRPGRPRPRAAPGPGSLDPQRSARIDRPRHGRAGGVRTHRGGPGYRRVRGAVEQLVCAPQPPPLLEAGGRPRQSRRLPHPVRMPCHGLALAGPVHPLRRR